MSFRSTASRVARSPLTHIFLVPATFSPVLCYTFLARRFYFADELQLDYKFLYDPHQTSRTMAFFLSLSQDTI